MGFQGGARTEILVVWYIGGKKMVVQLGGGEDVVPAPENFLAQMPRLHRQRLKLPLLGKFFLSTQLPASKTSPPSNCLSSRVHL
jgi:hypothetical protein